MTMIDLGGRLALNDSQAQLAPRPDFSTLLKRDADGSTKAEFAVEGMHCAGCMARIEAALAAEPGIARARVNLTEKRLAVSFNPGGADPAHVVDVLRRLGFRAHPFAPRDLESAEAREERRLLRCLGVAAFAAMNIMLLSVSVWSGHATGLGAETRDLFHWISALIALPTAAYAGRPFFDSAIRALKARAVNMDVPISLGILLALGMSVVETLHSAEHAYFDGAVMLIFFLLIGRTLDQMMRRKTRGFAANIAALRATTVVRIATDGTLSEVPVAAIAPGDRVLVRPGDRVGVDGTVEEGQSDLDQSLVTGETRLARVGVGDRVFAGTVNHAGTLTVRVWKAASGTLLDEIEQMLGRATEVRAGYVTLADRAARLYAPFVHATALITLIGWMVAGLAWNQALVIAITVLIITCPCALGLAIPAVQIVSAGALFRRGVLLNSGDALERLATVDTIVFDKTGTLTLPDASIANRAELPAEDLAIAGRLALSSRHPLARALAAATDATEPMGQVTELAGQGLVASTEAGELRLGSPGFCGLDAEAAALSLRYPEASMLAFRSPRTAFVMAMGQALRPDARMVVQTLRECGYQIHLISGDTPAAVRRIEAEIAFDGVVASARPDQKVDYLQQLREQGHHILMIGDGINDAPALAAAHASLSPVTAADITQTAADAVFLGERLKPVIEVLALSRKGRQIMLQNLWLAVVYNLIAVPIAIAGFATPLVAAAAMSGSSIIVTLNALRARSA